MPNLKDKVAIITGASSGIGAATAIHFASLGCNLALNGRNLEKLANVRAQCLKQGLDERNLILVPGDITEKEVTKEVVAKTVAHFGALDILINNAGLSRPEILGEEKDSNIELTMGTNFRAAYRMSTLAIPHLISSKGNIVNVSSAVSTITFSKLTVYGCSKSAMDYMTKNMAFELLTKDVRVNSVNPGSVLTDIMINSGSSQEEFQEVLKSFKEKAHIYGRIADPNEIAKPIAFLASDDASFITGALLVVDGGLSVRSPVS